MKLDPLQLSYEQLGKALHALSISIKKPADPDRTHIDATIQRFEFTIELYWKTLKKILATRGEIADYPKDILKASYKGHLIDDESIWLHMINDRNLTSHTYNEKLADEIYLRITNYYPILQSSYEKLNKFILLSS